MRWCLILCGLLVALSTPAYANDGKCRNLAVEWTALTKSAYKSGRIDMDAINNYRHPELREHLRIAVVAEMMRYGFQPQSGPIGADWVTVYNRCLAEFGK